MKKKIGFCVCFLMGCASDPAKVKKVDDHLEVHQNSTEGVIGIDKDQHAILQKQTTAADELRNQQWVNNSIEASVEDEFYWLKRCRMEVSDPRLGGNSEVKEIPEIDDMKTIATIKEEFGLSTDGQLSFVKREDFLKRIEIERSYQVSLTKMLKTLRKYREECDSKMGKLRVSVGLPAKRYQGKYTLNDSGSIHAVTQENESSLDDAFRIRDALSSEKKKKSE
jgi:hypothetical protein